MALGFFRTPVRMILSGLLVLFGLVLLVIQQEVRVSLLKRDATWISDDDGTGHNGEIQ